MQISPPGDSATILETHQVTSFVVTPQGVIFSACLRHHEPKICPFDKLRASSYGHTTNRAFGALQGPASFHGHPEASQAGFRLIHPGERPKMKADY